MMNAARLMILLCAALFAGWLLGAERADAQDPCPACPPCPVATATPPPDVQQAIDAAKAAIDAAKK